MRLANPTPPEDCIHFRVGPQEAEQSESLASVESELDSLYEKKDAAIRAIDVDEQAELEKQIRALEKKARSLAVVESQAQIAAREAAAQDIDSKFNAAWAKSLEHYPDLNDPESAMYKEIQRLDAEAQELGDPLFNDPEKLWDFAKKAAVKTRTLMAKPKTQSQAPAKGKTGSPVQPASGNARTTSADSNQAFAQKVEGLQTLDAYEEEIRMLKGVA